jgi:hypothetical protein
VPAKVKRERSFSPNMRVDGCTTVWYKMIVKLSKTKLDRLCRQRRVTLSRLLGEAGVSRNALYSLLRRREILPRSVTAVAAALRVSPSVLLEETPSPGAEMRRIMREVTAIRRRHPEADPDTIRHTLILLKEKPVERLRRSLLRAQKPDLQR